MFATGINWYLFRFITTRIDQYASAWLIQNFPGAKKELDACSHHTPHKIIAGGHCFAATSKGDLRKLVDLHGIPTITLPACIYRWADAKVYWNAVCVGM